MTGTSSRSVGISNLSGQQLRYGAAALGYLVAALHLFHPTHGFGRLVVLLLADPGLLLADPRPLAFVVSGVALLAGVNVLLLWERRTPVYVGGIALTLTYLVGYFAWHLSGHGGFLPGRKPIYHGLAPHEAVIAHLSTDPWAAGAVVSELALLVVLVVLYRRA